MRSIRLFFESTSIRGCSRIVRAEDKFLRHLWMTFVVCTTILLFVSAYKIVLDYLQFSVNIQTFQKLDDPSPFPAVTVCNHQPFSENAYKLWRSGTVLSPTEFNRLMRLGALSHLESTFSNGTVKGESGLYFSVGVAWDKVSIYYQNLSPQHSRQLGHDLGMIHNCMYMYGQVMGFDDRCDDEMWIVKNYSHPTYFNCLTIEASPAKRAEISQLGLIIWLGPPENYDIQYRQGFLFDIYQQAYGLRVVVHEPATFPNVERDGIHIEPGKMNEINYQATRFEKVNTMKNPCADQSPVKFPDLENIYAYEHELCLRDGIQRRILSKCSCLYGYYPRIVEPNDTIPYCAKLDTMDKLIKRAICAQRVLEQKGQIKMELEVSTCLKKCTEVGYDSTVSVTKWRPTAWQLHWLPESYKRYNELRNVPADDFQAIKERYDRMYNYFNQRNLSKYPGSEKRQFVFDESYTFVIVKRKDNSTQIKEERLVLTINALFSRIGGLCSLFIGLTLAFVMELIEFFYLVCYKHARAPYTTPSSVVNMRNTAAISTSPNKCSQYSQQQQQPSDLNDSIRINTRTSPSKEFPDDELTDVPLTQPRFVKQPLVM